MSDIFRRAIDSAREAIFWQMQHEQAHRISVELIERSAVYHEKFMKDLSENDSAFKQFAHKQLRDNSYDIQNYTPELFEKTAQRIVRVLLKAPHAARLQRTLDRHKHGREHHQKILDIITFNDAFVACFSDMKTADRLVFSKKLYEILQQFAQRFVREQTFSKEQYGAIVRGLSREVALAGALKKLGYQVQHADRNGDAMGVDLQIRQGNEFVNLDVKSVGAYERELRVRLAQGRIEQKEALDALETGYCPVINGHKSHKVHTILLCVDDFLLENDAPFLIKDVERIKLMMEAIFSQNACTSQQQCGEIMTIKEGGF